MAISGKASAAKLHRVASLTAILSQGLKAEKNPSLARSDSRVHAVL
jgi:hypothetical protein